MRAVIMAGGEGSRLRPLTSLLPKPMASVVNKPVMEHIIELLKKHGITNIAVTLQYLPQVIVDYFGDGQNFGVNIQYFTEDKPLGTAGSVKNTGDFINEPFIVISGDALTDINLNHAIEFHQNNKSLVTIILKSVDTPLEYGVVVTDDNGVITRFIEKPSWSEVFSDTVNTGIYILDPSVMEYVKHGEIFDFSKDLFPLLMNKGITMYGYKADGYWCDIGDIEAYRQCHFDILDKKVKIKHNASEIESGIWVDEGATIDRGVNINPPVYIGKNVHIKTGNQIGSYTVIGNNTFIGEYSIIDHGIVWQNAIIGKNVMIRGSIICDKAVIKDRATLDELSIIGKNSVIGEQSNVACGIKIWNDKIVDANELVTDNLIWGYKSHKLLFGDNGIEGDANVNITPEFSSKLACAYGNILGATAKVALSNDNSTVTHMIKSAVESGLLSSGAQVLEFGEQPIPITRAGIKFYGLSGGIHISTNPSKQKVTIDLLNQNGSNIGRDIERKLEGLFQREDYVKSNGESIKERVSLSSYKLFYLREIVNKCRNSQLNFNILLSIKNPLNKPLVMSLLSDLACDFKIYNENIDFNDKQSIEKFAVSVKDGNYDLGAVIDDRCEKIFLVDNRGSVISEDMFMCLSALITFRSKPSTTYIAPMSAPGVIEIIADKYGGKVIRTKSSSVEIMDKLAKNIKDLSQCSQFIIEFDAIGGLVKILDFLKNVDIKLSALVEDIPKFYLSKQEAACESKDKGVIIRKIIEQHQDRKLELTEGVKIYEKGGWVLVFPHSTKPAYKIVCEGYTEEIANELMNEYMFKISDIINKK